MGCALDADVGQFVINKKSQQLYEKFKFIYPNYRILVEAMIKIPSPKQIKNSESIINKIAQIDSLFSNSILCFVSALQLQQINVILIQQCTKQQELITRQCISFICSGQIYLPFLDFKNQPKDKAYAQRIKKEQKFMVFQHENNFQIVIPSDYRKIKYARISLNSFNLNFTKQFPSQSNKVYIRGGWPYYQPYLCSGLAINLKNYSDNGWLYMDGNQNQWAVAFLNIDRPSDINKFINQYHLNKSELSQQFINQKCALTDKLIGQGIYVTPHFEQCLFNRCKPSKYKQKVVYLMLQCRVNPKSIKVVKSRQTTWVIGSSQNIRAYQIIIVNQQDKKRIDPNYEKFNIQDLKEIAFKKIRQLSYIQK